jgi:ribosomal protein S18 acetylase RimI-like enzyme
MTTTVIPSERSSSVIPSERSSSVIPSERSESRNLHVSPPGVVRDATDADNAALVALAQTCPMRGALTMCVERAPDFFALARLEGERWRVGVAESGDGIVGCVAASERLAYVNGAATGTAYVGDLKVHPAHRGSFAADGLEEFAREAVRSYGGDDMLALLTVLGGNRSMERRAVGPRGLPALTRFATLDVHAIPLLWPRSHAIDGVRVRAARAEDLDEMGALWHRIAPARQLAPVLDAAKLKRWIDAAPGLAVDDYLVAQRADGRVVGFLALWDQYLVKQLRVLSYTTRLAVVRAALNAVTPIARTPKLPAAGAVLPSLAVVHCCVAGDAPNVLRALLLHAYATRRGAGYLFLTLALDRRDPLRVALRGLLSQPTVVGAYATTPAGRYTGAPLDSRPLHFESALV